MYAYVNLLIHAHACMHFPSAHCLYRCFTKLVDTKVPSLADSKVYVEFPVLEEELGEMSLPDGLQVQEPL